MRYGVKKHGLVGEVAGRGDYIGGASGVPDDPGGQVQRKRVSVGLSCQRSQGLSVEIGVIDEHGLGGEGQSQQSQSQDECGSSCGHGYSPFTVEFCESADSILLKRQDAVSRPGVTIEFRYILVA